MVGDCTLSSSQLYPHFEYIVDGDMSWPFSGTVQYFEDDYLTIANLECSLSEEKLTGYTTFWFCGAAENAQILVDGSVEFVTLGNNHTMDFGQTGWRIRGGARQLRHSLWRTGRQLCLPAGRRHNDWPVRCQVAGHAV